MRKRVRKAYRKLRKGDVPGAVRALVTPHHTETRILTARAAVATHLQGLYENRVVHGPFAGMLLPDRAYWGNDDVSAKILGTYERHVADRLVDLAQPNGLLIDVGSADGYFAVGALTAGLFGRCVCFEISEKGRAVLLANAERNGVADRMEIHGEATAAELLQAAAETPGVVLCDIEGGEFGLFSDAVLGRLSAMHLVIELHDDLVEDGLARKNELVRRADDHFDVEIMRSSIPDPFSYRELDGFDDDHRLLALSEGRDGAMEWLVLHPKAQR